MAAAVARAETKWAAQGIAITHAKGGLAPFPDPDHDMWYAADRTVITISRVGLVIIEILLILLLS